MLRRHYFFFRCLRRCYAFIDSLPFDATPLISFDADAAISRHATFRHIAWRHVAAAIDTPLALTLIITPHAAAEDTFAPRRRLLMLLPFAPCILHAASAIRRRAIDTLSAIRHTAILPPRRRTLSPPPCD